MALGAQRVRSRRKFCVSSVGTGFAFEWQCVSRPMHLTREKKMTGKADEIKGRVKEAAGAIPDDDRLREEGKIDQATGKVKQAAEKMIDKVQDVIKDANKR